jgi:two-component system cell cycle response regulator
MDDRTQMLEEEQKKKLERRSRSSKLSASLIVISGVSTGRMFQVNRDVMVIGRDAGADIPIDDDQISRRHAEIRRQADGSLVLKDLDSTNGTYFLGMKVTSRALEDGDLLALGGGTILKFRYQDEVEEAYQRHMLRSASRDGLTGSYNRLFFEERLLTEFSYASRNNTFLSLVMFDIDHFKRVNDTFGHTAGDEVLMNLARLVQDDIRNEDIFARYGGEEFVLILRGISRDAAFITAERIRRKIDHHTFVFGGDEIPVTIRLGVATLVDGIPASPEELVMKADERLYKAKEDGRNCSRF